MQLVGGKPGKHRADPSELYRHKPSLRRAVTIEIVERTGDAEEVKPVVVGSRGASGRRAGAALTVAGVVRVMARGEERGAQQAGGGGTRQQTCAILGEEQECTIGSRVPRECAHLVRLPVHRVRPRRRREQRAHLRRARGPHLCQPPPNALTSRPPTPRTLFSNDFKPALHYCVSRELM
ncbi:hypothetical protein EVAR_822_1 [Eumeta japonica]|uniref:Uncharacterized protein n=1 Tax=Eumeta variegata TaxID=151549 RepID=A0A4C1SDF4_EUMVA|nr:hypothetical protein EVAR_822_1 [Eumeta japonica]